MWVRGLKPVLLHGAIIATQSHPMWVRGLKLQSEGCQRVQRVSHPMWVRGLKPRIYVKERFAISVAPYVGAWIETAISRLMYNNVNSRTLCGCVD